MLPDDAEVTEALVGARRQELDWDHLVRVALQHRPPPLCADIIVSRVMSSFSRPILLRCGGNGYFMAKARRAGVQDKERARSLIADQVVGFLGHSLGAPVPKVALIDIPQHVIDRSRSDPDLHLDDIAPGIAHGSVYLDFCTERLPLNALSRASNPPEELAALALLYGWVLAADHQVILQGQRAWSVDHGHFLPGSVQWDVQSLEAGARAPAEPDKEVVRHAGLGQEQLLSVAHRLKRLVMPAFIAEAVARPPDDWGITMDERTALARFLHKRWESLLASLGV